MAGPLAVILSSDDQFRPPDVAKAIAAYRHILAYDAAGEARRSWGIIGEDLSAGEAERLINALAACGLSARPAPMEALGGKPEPLTAVKMQAGPAGFRAFLKDGSKLEVEWPRLAVIAAGAFRHTNTRTVTEKEGPTIGQQALGMGLALTTGLPVRVGPKKKTVEKKIEDVELRLVMDLIEAPSRRWVRVDGLSFDYGILGGEMEAGALGNFRKLLLRFAAPAPGARLSKGALALLKNQPLTAVGYEDVGSMERESRWLFALGPRG